MTPLIQEALSICNLPATVFLGIILGYWLLAVLGLLGDYFDIGELGGDEGAFGEAAEAGFWARCGRFLHLGQVPLIVVLSFLALFVWPLSILGNYYLNGTPGDRSTAMAALLLIPNIVLSMLLTRLAVTPLRRLFAAMQSSSTEAETVIGRVGRVVSARVDEHHGRLEIPTIGAPLIIQARVPAGAPPLAKGANALAFAASPDGATYLVKAIDNPVVDSDSPTPNT